VSGGSGRPAEIDDQTVRMRSANDPPSSNPG
jgi:hypothetical protein